VKRALGYVIGLMFDQDTASTKVIREVPIRESMFVLGCCSIIIFLPLWSNFTELVTNNFWRFTIIGLAIPLLFAVLLLSTAIEAGLTLWRIRHAGKTTNFRSLLCLLILLEAGFSLPPSVTSVVAEKNWEGWWFQLIFEGLMAIWFFIVFLRSLRITHDLSHSEAYKAALPVLVVSGILFLLSWTSFPPSLYNAQRWQRAVGERFTVYYPRGDLKPDQLIEESGDILQRIGQYWRLEPLSESIDVFLFPNTVAHQRVSQDRELAGAAHSPEIAISLVYGEWHKIKRIVTHELTHLITHRRLAKSLPAVVNEGIATHTEITLRFETKPLIHRPHPNLSLMDLASDKRFYDRTYDVRSHYVHAAVFVRDVIDEYGIERFKEFCRRLSDRRERELFLGDDRNQVSEAFRETYGISLIEWERTWKLRWKNLIVPATDKS
jgi:hypothetical protein